MQGHYIAYVRKQLGEESVWFRCDDDSVVRVDRSEVEDAEGYLLLYARVNNNVK